MTVIELHDVDLGNKGEKLVMAFSVKALPD